LNILILGIGNILFGDEGIGPHLANFIEEKYEFSSAYDRVLLIDCVNVDDGEIGDVYSFYFDKVPDYITWNGSAHEVEMLQTLQMIELMGDLPPVKIVGVIPYVIGENSTFTMTDEVIKASLTMEKTIIDYIRSFDISVKVKQSELKITDVTQLTYLKGIEYDIGV